MNAVLPGWLTLCAAGTVFTVMMSLGLLLGREQFAAALQRRTVLAAILFAVVIPVPALAVLFVKLLGLKGPVAAGIVLMSISPGAPVALRRAIDVGGRAQFAPALHLAIVMLAVVTVPFSIFVLDIIFSANFRVSPLDIARQVFVAQLVPLGLGASIRAYLPAAAVRLGPLLTSLSNVLLLALLAACVYTLWPMLVSIGWTPTVGGVVLTASALLVGGLSAGRDIDARPPAAVAAAMRNPGLALLIATVNRAPSGVTAAVFGYALGAVAVVTAYVLWYGRRREEVRQDSIDLHPRLDVELSRIMTRNPPSPATLRLENRHTGEVLEMRRQRRDGDTFLELRGTLPPHSEGPPMHIHHFEDEEGLVTAGTLSADVGGQQVEVGTGHTVRLPRGIAHRWWNGGDQLLAFEGRTHPVVDFDRYLQAMFEVLNAGTPTRPALFYLAHAAVRHRRTQTVLVMPGPIQAILFRLVVAVGTLLGRYRGTEWPGCPARCTGVPEA